MVRHKVPIEGTQCERKSALGWETDERESETESIPLSMERHSGRHKELQTGIIGLTDIENGDFREGRRPD